MKFWLIKWNAEAKGAKRSSRMFRVFLVRPELFEAYGYRKKTDSKLFEQVKKGHQVFCYQKNEKKIVGLCEVETTEDGNKNGVGGRCLVLRAKIHFLQIKWTKKCGNISQMSENEANEIFKLCGLKWSGE